MQPGWFPDPDDPNARRYWDGEYWSAPLPIDASAETEQAVVPASTSLDLGEEPRSPGAAAKERGQAIWQEKLEASKRKSVEQPTLCISGDCQNPRAADRFLCAEHQANVDANMTPEQRAIQQRLAASHAKVVDAQAKSAKATQRVERLQRMQRRPGDVNIVCPHCQVTGRVISRKVRQKKGISGGKATGAVLTAGISLLGTGLSRKETATEMKCGNCQTVWYV